MIRYAPNTPAIPAINSTLHTNATLRIILEGAKKTGLGAQRHCDLGKGNHLEEDVVKFEPLQAITFRITKSNMPFARADIRLAQLLETRIRRP